MSRGGVKNLVSLVSDMREAAEAENNVPNTDVREPLSDKEMAAASKRVDAIKDRDVKRGVQFARLENGKAIAYPRTPI